MPAITFPSGLFTNKTTGAVLASGQLYIGEPDTDPTVLANRITVEVIQENGTPVSVPGSAQPFTFTTGGLIQYQGSVVQMRVGQNFSMTVQDSNDVQQYYFPSVVSGEETVTSLVQLVAQGSDPTPVSGSGFLYSKEVSGTAELFYEDDQGNVIQITENGNLKISLPDAVLDVLGVASGYYLGAVQELTISAGEVAIDWQAGQYFSYTNTGAHTITFSNVPLIGDGYGQTIMLAIEDAGNFAITLDPSLGYTVYRRSTDDLGALTVDGLDLLICTVYNSGIVTVVPLLDFVPNV